MKSYLESKPLQNYVTEFFLSDRPVGAICHGVVVLARCLTPQGQKSVLFGRKTTALTRFMELSAWLMTVWWLGNYYRTYSQTVQSEVTQSLSSASDFWSGPVPLKRDSPTRLSDGFALTDKNYVSARWPGDAHRFAHTFNDLLQQPR